VENPTPTPPVAPPDAAVVAVADDCDETSCVLSKYDRPCCAKYKPATTPDFKPRVGDVPESLDKSMVRAGVERVKPRVVSCGEKSGAKGTVKIAMTVSASGDVTSASVADSPDATLGDCVLAAMRNAKFGKTVNGATFTYPFAF
jgi:TonB family protein